MNAKRIQFEGMRCAGLAHTGPYHEIGATFSQIAGWAGERGMLDREFIGVYYDNPETTPADQLRSHAAFPIREGESVEGSGLEEFEIPSGEYFVTTHMGTYDGLPGAWAGFMGDVAASGARLNYDWTFEVYVNDCEKVAAEDVRTDIYAGLIID